MELGLYLCMIMIPIWFDIPNYNGLNVECGDWHDRLRYLDLNHGHSDIQQSKLELCQLINKPPTNKIN